MIAKDFKRVLVLNGEKFTVKISPCSWMNQHYGFQIDIQRETGGSILIRRPEVKFEDATEELVKEMYSTVKLVKCKNDGCTNTQFVDETSNRKGECEKCFGIRIDKEFEEESKKEKEQLRKQDQRMRAKGAKWKVTVWVHAGGDDRCEDWYLSGDEKPSDKMIQSKLKKMRSRVLTDYTITKL